jgi:hypothetical protein
MADKLITIYKFNTSAGAYIWKSKLESEGIVSFIVHDSPNIPFGYIELQVREKDVDKAKRIVEAIRVTPKLIVPKKLMILNLIVGIFAITYGIITLVKRYNSFVAIVSIIVGLLLLIVDALNLTIQASKYPS